MKVRAIIFDVYGTLLQVGAPPGDADDRWHQLFQNMFGETPPFSRTEFSVRTNQIIARRHATARARGIRWPEVLWPSIVAEALPAFTRLSGEKADEFIFQQMQTGRTLRLTRGAGECLRAIRARGIQPGIASNAQNYTLRELDEALRDAAASLSFFDPQLCFWSFQHGFSKPDPHVFQILTARLEARGISPDEILMVGDRIDNDVEPAHAHGWQTYHLIDRGEDDSGHTEAFRELMVRCEEAGA